MIHFNLKILNKQTSTEPVIGVISLRLSTKCDIQEYSEIRWEIVKILWDLKYKKINQMETLEVEISISEIINSIN